MNDHRMHHKHHHTHNDSLGSLLDRCCHYLAHRIGGKKRGQESILTLISQHPGITQKGLAEAVNIQPASVSELLMKLEKKGLVLREKDETDRRSIKVQLTADGRAHLAEPEEEKSADPFLALSAEEQEQLRNLLKKLLTDWEHRFPAEHHRHNHHNHHHDKENHNGKYE